MALKQYTFNERRVLILNDILKNLTSINQINYQNRSACSDFSDMINLAKSNGSIFSSNFEKEVNLKYGYSDDKNDPEYLLAKICFILPFFRVYGSWNRGWVEMIKKIVEVLTSLFPEFEIDFKTAGAFPDWISISQATIIENIANINEVTAEPIVELLKPMKSEDELIGLISKVYSKIEHIDSQKQEHLVKTDKDILDTTVRFVKHLVNRVDSAKGHSSDSSLSVKDIAHNVALGASLIHKLINKKTQG